MTAHGPGETCPQCSYPIPASQPALCPNCQYPLLFEEHDDDRQAVADRQLRRPSQPEPDDQTMINPRVRAQPVVTVPAGQRQGPSRTCPLCGWANALTRARCERCSAEMRVAEAPAPVAPPVPVSTRRSRAWIFIPVAIVLAVLLGVGTFWVTSRPGVLTQTATPTPGESVTPSGQSTTTLTKIDAKTIKGKASSTLPTDAGGSYGISKTLDGDLKSAWESNGTGDGEVTLTYTFAGAVQIGKIEFYSGVQRDDGVFGRNGRVKSLEVDVDGSGHTFTLSDKRGKQSLTYAFPEGTKITLTVKTVTRGSRHADLGITEVAFFAAG